MVQDHFSFCNASTDGGIVYKLKRIGFIQILCFECVDVQFIVALEGADNKMVK